jgi:hypothetical protein
VSIVFNKLEWSIWLRDDHSSVSSVRWSRVSIRIDSNYVGIDAHSPWMTERSSLEFIDRNCALLITHDSCVIAVAVLKILFKSTIAFLYEDFVALQR